MTLTRTHQPSDATPTRWSLTMTTGLASLRRAGIAVPFAALFVVLIFANDAFLTKDNLLNILDQQSATLIIAAAGTLVFIAGGLDLSVGAVYALAAVVAGRIAEHG